MNTTQYKRWSQNRHFHRKHFLTALLIAVMVIVSTVPAFATEIPTDTSAPDTEVSTLTPDLVEDPGDKDGAFPDGTDSSEVVPAPTHGPVSTIEELLDAIAHANANDVIEFDAIIQTPPELILGRADCPVTIRRTTSEAYLVLGEPGAGNIKVQNITFDGAEIQATFPLVSTDSPMQIFEKCSFVNCITEHGPALSITNGNTFISDCYFANNIGYVGAHLRTDGHTKATIENCTFTGGYAIYKGSVFINADVEALLIGCTVSGNTAGEQGGGIYVCSALNVIGSKIYGNTVNGVADDITKDYWGRLSLADDYATLVELYKPDGVIPNRWTVDSRFDGAYEMDFYHANMVFSMTFADNEPSSQPLPAFITLNKSELALTVGETETLTATLYPENTSSSIQWTSSNPTVASVTERGFITAHSVGAALITATATDGGASASCRVDVQAIPATTYFIDIGANPTEGGVVGGNGQYEEGSTATVTAVSNDGFRFLAWAEADTQISTEASLTFTVSNDRMLTAIFEPTTEPITQPTYTINISATVGGIAEGGGSYKEGKPVAVNAVPNAGYRFLRWEENGVQVSTEARYSFTAEADRTLVAIFEWIPQSAPNSTYEPPTFRGPGSNNAQIVTTSMSSQKEIQMPKLISGKTVLTAPDDLFWVGYRTGRDNGTETVTRADLAQLVYSMMDNESRKLYGVTRSPFRDVEPGTWYKAAVEAMLDTGIMVGCGNGLFCPDRTLTWGELLTVFARFAEDNPLTEYYTGAHWSNNAVNKAFAFGWLEYSESFNPGSTVTTGEMADLIQAIFQWNNK